MRPGPKKSILKRIEILGRKGLMRLFGLMQPKRTFSELPPDAPRRKILLMRQDKLGDMAVTLPYFRALKKVLPDSEIAILASRRNKILLKYEPGFRQIIYDKRPHKFLLSLWQVFRFHPDVVVDLQLKESATSTIYVLASRAKWRIRAVRPVKLPFNVWVPIGDDWHIRREMETLIGTVAPLDVNSVPQEIKLSEREQAFAIKFFSTLQVPKNRLVGLNISAGKPERTLSVPEYSSICYGLLRRGFVPVILYAPQDKSRARQIVSYPHTRGAVLAPETPDVLCAIALVRELFALITPDTSMVHFASAMGVPVLALYTANDWNCNRWLPWGVPYRFCQSKDHDTMEGISIDEVLAKFDELVAEISR